MSTIVDQANIFLIDGNAVLVLVTYNLKQKIDIVFLLQFFLTKRLGHFGQIMKQGSRVSHINISKFMQLM